MESNQNLLSLASELEELILTVVPGAEKVGKYGGTLFTLRPDEKEGQFCGVFIYNQHVQISFSKGAQLDDPNRILKGAGKLRRHVNFTSVNDVDLCDLEELLERASKL